jgi:hypothetical protein
MEEKLRQRFFAACECRSSAKGWCGLSLSELNAKWDACQHDFSERIERKTPDGEVWAVHSYCSKCGYGQREELAQKR